MGDQSLPEQLRLGKDPVPLTPRTLAASLWTGPESTTWPGFRSRRAATAACRHGGRYDGWGGFLVSAG